jgi:hypothetical protein
VVHNTQVAQTAQLQELTSAMVSDKSYVLAEDIIPFVRRNLDNKVLVALLWENFTTNYNKLPEYSWELIEPLVNTDKYSDFAKFIKRKQLEEEAEAKSVASKETPTGMTFAKQWEGTVLLEEDSHGNYKFPITVNDNFFMEKGYFCTNKRPHNHEACGKVCSLRVRGKEVEQFCRYPHKKDETSEGAFYCKNSECCWGDCVNFHAPGTRPWENQEICEILYQNHQEWLHRRQQNRGGGAGGGRRDEE